ncbi:MAG: IS4 family transposase [Actinobacteria bacterium]|nr:IS4 family transposase [Actinomycetota bacterium]
MAHRNQGRLSCQVESLQRQFAQAPGLPFAEVLAAEQVEQVLAAENVEFAERLYTPLVTLWVWLTQVVDPDHSLRQAVARLLAWRVARAEPSCSSDTGAYAKARQRLPENVLAELTRRSGRDLMMEAPAPWSWHGRDVKLVDGSTASMPDTPANQAAYPQAGTQKAGVGFPILRFVVLFSLAVGSVLNAAYGPYQGKRTGETALLRQLHDDLDEGDVVLGDRYFCSFFEIALLQERRVDAVLRLHQRRRADFRRGQRLGKCDHLVTWYKPERPDWMDQATYERLPKTLTVRELRVHAPVKRFRTRVITAVTTLLDPVDFPKADIAELYRWRWHAELDLRSLKQTLQMDVLRGKTPAIVQKELWAHLLVYNLIRKVMVQAAANHGLDPRTLSFKGAVQTLNAFALPLLTCSAASLPAVIAALLEAIVRHRVGNRPGRFEPRARKRRPKPYPLLTRPRAEARTLELKKACG